MRTYNLEIGKKGEDIAKKYLENKGYKIIDHNYKTKYSEIDLVCQKDNELVFVEVRTKTNERFGSPEETINKDKIKRLIRAASAYVNRKNWQGPYRIDVCSVLLNKDLNLNKIQHYENIM